MHGLFFYFKGKFVILLYLKIYKDKNIFFCRFKKYELENN